MVKLKELIALTLAGVIMGLVPHIARADESNTTEGDSNQSVISGDPLSQGTPSQDAIPAEPEAIPLDEGSTVESDLSTAEPSSAAGEKRDNKKLKKQALKPAKTPEKISEETMAASSETAQPAILEAPLVPAGAELSQGERLAIDGKGFSIKPPAGWIVERNHPRISLSLMLPVAQGQYPSNINVVRLSGPRIISQESADKFAEKIVKEFPAASVTIENYSLRNSQLIQLADGRQALLFYTDFMSSGRRMMQAHILASSQTNHYILTYTDVAENFEPGADGAQSQIFNNAWESLSSIELDSPNPSPSADITWIAGAISVLFVLWVIIGFVRNRRAAAEYRQFADRGHSAGDNDELISSLAQVGIGQRVSLEPTVMTLKQDEDKNSSIQSTASTAAVEPVRGKKIKVGKRDIESPRTQDVEDLSVKAAEVSSIEFSQDKFKREV